MRDNKSEQVLRKLKIKLSSSNVPFNKELTLNTSGNILTVLNMKLFFTEWDNRH